MLSFWRSWLWCWLQVVSSDFYVDATGACEWNLRKNKSGGMVQMVLNTIQIKELGFNLGRNCLIWEWMGSEGEAPGWGEAHVNGGQRLGQCLLLIKSRNFTPLCTTPRDQVQQFDRKRSDNGWTLMYHITLNSIYSVVSFLKFIPFHGNDTVLRFLVLVEEFDDQPTRIKMTSLPRTSVCEMRWNEINEGRSQKITKVDLQRWQ